MQVPLRPGGHGRVGPANRYRRQAETSYQAAEARVKLVQRRGCNPGAPPHWQPSQSVSLGSNLSLHWDSSCAARHTNLTTHIVTRLDITFRGLSRLARCCPDRSLQLEKQLVPGRLRGSPA